MLTCVMAGVGGGLLAYAINSGIAKLQQRNRVYVVALSNDWLEGYHILTTERSFGCQPVYPQWLLHSSRHCASLLAQ